jgi:hypothetical protein
MSLPKSTGKSRADIKKDLDEYNKQKVITALKFYRTWKNILDGLKPNQVIDLIQHKCGVNPSNNQKPFWTKDRKKSYDGDTPLEALANELRRTK